jgi:hypothetical protein
MKANWKVIKLLAEGWELVVNALTLKQWVFLLIITGLLTALLVPVIV